jgi:hypothetical protein
MFSLKSNVWCGRCERPVSVRRFGLRASKCPRCQSAGLKPLQQAMRWCRPCGRYGAAVRPQGGRGWQCAACHSKDVFAWRLWAAIRFALFSRSRDASAVGFVYVMTNSSMPGVVKVGSTASDPRHRAVQLRSTGVPTTFAVAYARKCVAYERAERAAHAKLARHRVNTHREFFSVTVAEAARAIESVC